MVGLQGKVAIITGAGQGIGRMLALTLASEGMSLVLNDQHVDRLSETIDQVEAREALALAVAGSVADHGMPQRLVSETMDRFGDLHLLVTCAYSSSETEFPLMTDAQLETALDTQFTGVTQVAKEAFKLMRDRATFERERGQNPAARKVITVSTATNLKSQQQAAYAATKAGTAGLIRAMAAEGGSFNLQANAVVVSPLDPVSAPPVRASNGDSLNEVVRPLLFLISEGANPISGVVLEVTSLPQKAS
jgi:NAD(P)-dependent dehydrogenase (short-subunit alcohol dehydrogenase family)